MGGFLTDVECDRFKVGDAYWEKIFRRYFDYDVPQILQGRETFAMPVAESRCILLEKETDESCSYIYFGDTFRNPLFYQHCAEADNAVRGVDTTTGQLETSQSIASSVQGSASHGGFSISTAGTHWTCSVSARDPSTFPCSLVGPN